MNIAVFASGSGSNFDVIARQAQEGILDVKVKLLVCDKEHAPVQQKAQALGVPVFRFVPSNYEHKEDFEKDILHVLHEADVELLVLAGYMRLIGPTLLQAYEGKILNIHPSLLPAFPGKDAIEQALQANVKVTGVTIHLVDEGMDTGPIIEQEALRIEEGEDASAVQKKIQQMEHRLYPQVIQQIVKGEI
ncbi:phosphoribosylglycinamide formyltransferase [Pontibacillus litoralis]|uniref:Phosphoribosylglycinamide formyltransferase n=1 Tax=Pontibacillus litoralis JSM 072002 TaxID=1385512 RepID=A0A0A5G873_9BACI|nr:phosphoribosylglycinamide formyltransferase [Pontibacillus litoralis]KGX88244.1 phosphoribosylglycinamide formyltransferase [Pontibacillus litoralis JSM 072002]